MIVLQHVIFPEPLIGTDPTLYFRLEGAEDFRDADATLHLGPDTRLSFDTYFNAFSYGRWRAIAGVETLALALEGEGKVELQVVHAKPDQSLEVVFSDVVTLVDTPGIYVDLTERLIHSDLGMVYFTLRSTDGAATLRRGAFVTEDHPRRDVRLALSITTFQREVMVKTTVARIDQFMERSSFRSNMHLFVVDNGDSAHLPHSPRVTRIVNRNLGGAGGFSRGLLEAEAQGFSHVLFMDDDAAIHLEAIHRTFALLALSQDPSVAVAGAMINSTQPWQMWENTAVFDGKCMPRFSGVDLRDAKAVVAMDVAATAPAPDKTYGGWWFFAFPVAHVEYFPFPFFVRGDDVNFSLANPFKIVTLNGVVSFADDFTDKESPLTWYLDLRSHMVHHLTLDKMEIGRIRVAKIGVWFFLRNLARFQYDTIEAVLMAWQDVIRGPEFFVQNADMVERRAQIKALTRAEAWTPLADLDLSQRLRYGADHWLAAGRLSHQPERSSAAVLHILGQQGGDPIARARPLQGCLGVLADHLSEPGPRHGLYGAPVKTPVPGAVSAIAGDFGTVLVAISVFAGQVSQTLSRNDPAPILARHIEAWRGVSGRVPDGDEMIVADTERFVFIHNPKVGGMTFRTALKPYDTRDNFFFEWQQIGPAKKQIDMAHITLAQLREFFPEVLDQVAPYFKFGFVRNPYTRFLSAVSQHIKLGTPHTRAAILREPDLFYRTASSFALTVLDRNRIAGDHRLVHFREQGDFFYLEGAPWADCILKLEEPRGHRHHPDRRLAGRCGSQPEEPDRALCQDRL